MVNINLKKIRFAKGVTILTTPDGGHGMGNVIITDSRPKWILKEDKHMACMTRCYLYKCCSTRVGYSCKRLGGGVILRIQR